MGEQAEQDERDYEVDRQLREDGKFPFEKPERIYIYDEEDMLAFGRKVQEAIIKMAVKEENDARAERLAGHEPEYWSCYEDGVNVVKVQAMDLDLHALLDSEE
jgi:hypothetical protein